MSFNSSNTVTSRVSPRCGSTIRNWAKARGRAMAKAKAKAKVKVKVKAKAKVKIGVAINKTSWADLRSNQGAGADALAPFLSRASRRCD